VRIFKSNDKPRMRSSCSENPSLKGELGPNGTLLRSWFFGAGVPQPLISQETIDGRIVCRLLYKR